MAHGVQIQLRERLPQPRDMLALAALLLGQELDVLAHTHRLALPDANPSPGRSCDMRS
jgi:hypothetical protein